MKHIMRNIFLCLLSWIMVVGLVSCGGTGAIKSTAEESRVVATCGDYKVRYEELRYIVMTCKAELEARYGEDIFLTAESAALYEDELWERVSFCLCQSYAVLDACAEADIKTSDRVTKNEAQEHVDEVVEYLGGVDAYKEYLEASYMTDWVFRLYASVVSCQYRYFEQLAKEIERESYDAVLAHKGFIHTLSILIKNDAGEDIVENRAKAEYVRQQIEAGKTLESFVGTKYNQDTSDCEYYFVRGYMDKAYEEAAFALAEGEISPVVETRDGFYIIRRLPVDDAYFELYLDELMQIYQIAAMNQKFDEKQAALSLELNEEGKKLVLWEMK